MKLGEIRGSNTSEKRQTRIFYQITSQTLKPNYSAILYTVAAKVTVCPTDIGPTSRPHISG